MHAQQSTDRQFEITFLHTRGSSKQIICNFFWFTFCQGCGRAFSLNVWSNFSVSHFCFKFQPVSFQNGIAYTRMHFTYVLIGSYWMWHSNKIMIPSMLFECACAHKQTNVVWTVRKIYRCFIMPFAQPAYALKFYRFVALGSQFHEPKTKIFESNQLPMHNLAIILDEIIRAHLIFVIYILILNWVVSLSVMTNRKKKRKKEL